NRVYDGKLLEGDLAEAWREGETDYATVAMRYSLVDEMLDRESGRVLQGGPDEATEIWTFMRVRGGHWLVSAIQQSSDSRGVDGRLVPAIGCYRSLFG